MEILIGGPPWWSRWCKLCVSKTHIFSLSSHWLFIQWIKKSFHRKTFCPNPALPVQRWIQHDWVLQVLQLDLFSSPHFRFTDEVSDFKSDLSQLMSLLTSKYKEKLEISDLSEWCCFVQNQQQQFSWLIADGLNFIDAIAINFIALLLVFIAITRLYSGVDV